MRHITIAGLVVAGTIITGMGTAQADGITVGQTSVSQAGDFRKDWKPCVYEDSNNCVWDAVHMGNGGGKSFKVSKGGKVTYITHRRAHWLLNR